MSHARWTSVLGLDKTAREARLGFLEVGGEDRALLGELAEVLTPHIDEIVDEWHAFLLKRPETSGLLSRGRVQEHLRVMQARYFRTLLTGPYDREYFDDRLRIGFIHERVGLEPAWYTGSYRKYQSLVRALLVREGHDPGRIARWLEALEKVTSLDMELALDAYFHTRNAEILKANEALQRMARELEVRNLELTRQFERAREAARIKEEFLSKVSHELRTPLNAVLGFADLVADGIEGPVTPEQAQSLGKIRRHGERLLEMVDQMIDAAKMAAAGMGEPQPFDLEPVLERIAAATRGPAELKGLGFEVRVDPGLPQAVGDEEGFELALGRVLENAVKFTHAGRVCLEVHALGDVVRCTVTDTGPGVAEEHRERIFEAFHQADAGDTRTSTGLGMGLALARQALERMGGTLELAKTGPRGSTFAVEIPASAGSGSKAGGGSD